MSDIIRAIDKKLYECRKKTIYMGHLEGGSSVKLSFEDTWNLAMSRKGEDILGRWKGQRPGVRAGSKCRFSQ